MHPEGFYAAHDIELRPSTPVSSIDPASRQLELASGERIGYERLLLATGAAPRRLRLPGRSWTASSTCAPGGTPIAWRPPPPAPACGGGGDRLDRQRGRRLLRELGREVTLIGPDPAPLARVLGPEIAAVYRDLHADHGVRLQLGTRVAGLRGHGRSRPS